MSAPFNVVCLIAGSSRLTFECSDLHRLQADEQMSQDLSLDSEDSILLVHAITKLIVRIILDGAARSSRLQHSNGERVRSADAK